MPPRSLRVPGADGLELHVLEWSREGVPFLLLHGFGHEAHVWDDLAPALAPYYRTLAVDLRGHGDSDHDPEARYGYASHVRDLDTLTRHLGIERLVLLGHSLGGRIATLFAGQHPQRMAGLVLVDSAPEHDPRGSLRIGLDLQRSRDPSFASPAQYELGLARAYPGAAPALRERLARHGLRRREDGRFVPKLDPRFRELAGRAADGSHGPSVRELWEALERVPCPTLVVRGAASDLLAPDVAERMVERALPDGRLAVVARAGHSVMLDNPEGLREAVLAFAVGEEDD